MESVENINLETEEIKPHFAQEYSKPEIEEVEDDFLVDETEDLSEYEAEFEGENLDS